MVAAPSGVVVNGAFGLTVQATDQYGNVDTRFNGTVTLQLSSNPGGATLGGFLTGQATNGVARFSGLTLNRPGNGYVLQVNTLSLGTFATAAFNATYQLVVTTQPPSNFAVDTPFGLAVAVEDGDGTVQTGFNGNVTLSDANGTKLYGTTTVAAVNGVASFSGLTEGAAINGDELEASSAGVPTVNSSQFSVTALTATQLAMSAPAGCYHQRHIQRDSQCGGWFGDCGRDVQWACDAVICGQSAERDTRRSGRDTDGAGV